MKKFRVPQGVGLPFAYYKRLSTRQKRIYDKSDAVSSVRIHQPERFAPTIAAIAHGLQIADRRATEAACQEFSRQLLESLRVPLVQVRVLAKRPSHNWGELHGLYEPGEKAARPLLTVWMRTAQRREVVAFRTFLRTLLHEIGHHLDYELLQLEDSLHTQGFYKRESSLFRQLVPENPDAEGAGPEPTHTGGATKGQRKRGSRATTKATPRQGKPMAAQTQSGQIGTSVRAMDGPASTSGPTKARPPRRQKARPPEVVQPSLFED